MPEVSLDDWLKFYESPLPMAAGVSKLDRIAEQGASQLRHVLELAIETGVLPKSCKLAQFIHVEPIDLDIDFELPTVVRHAEPADIVYAAALQGLYVKDSGVSFFRDAQSSVRETGKGIICSLAIEQQEAGNSSLFVREFVILGSKSAADCAAPSAPSVPKLRRTQIGTSAWDFLPGAGFFDVMESLAPLPKEQHVDYDARRAPMFSKILSDSLSDYLANLAPLITHGTVILCVPALYRFLEGPEDVLLGGCGALYVVDANFEDRDLSRLHSIAHRLCTVASSVLDTARIASLRGERVGYKKGEFMIAHELDGPIGVLNEERGNLSNSGRLAVDYLELWRRVVKNDWSDSIPNSIEELFRDNIALLDTVLQFGYERAIRRSAIPRYFEGRVLMFRSFEDLRAHLDEWLDAAIELPEELVESRSPWGAQAKSWVMFLLIGSLHHCLAYAFLNCRRFEEWRLATGVCKASLDIRWEQPCSDQISLWITNSGHPLSGVDQRVDNVLYPVRSRELGTLRMPQISLPEDADVRSVVISPPTPVNSGGPPGCLWTARIDILRKPQS